MLLVLLGNSICSFTVSAQGFDSTHIGIHKFESDLHRWDILNADSLFPEFKKGKQEARQGHLDKAEVEIRNGLKRYQAAAYL